MRSFAYLPLVVALGLASIFLVVESAVKHPVILIPGDGGSQLLSKLNKTSGPHVWCERHSSGWELIWVSLIDFTPGFQACFVEDMMLIYDNKTRKTREPEGVQIRPYPVGDTLSVEWLDPSEISHVVAGVSYFNPIVEDLILQGYERNVSVRGAPFDFRRAPNEMGQYYKDLQKLIEDTYALNNNSKCVVVGHSMGNPVFLYFLNHQPQAWKDKYIESFVSLAGVWGGAVKPLRLYTSGDSLGVVIVSPNTVRPEQRAMPSTAFLMPSDKLWGPEEVLVITEHRNYTVKDYNAFFKDINFMDGWNMFLDTKDLIHDITPPGVPVHCIHGFGLKTPGTLVFGKGQFPDTYPDMIADDGDGTVNIRSLRACLDWSGKQKYPVRHMAIPEAEHMEILSDPAARNYVVRVALGKWV